VAESDDRDETATERLDRNWADMLQELRVIQTGVQLLSGFLLTLPFTERFADLDHWQVRLYLAVVLVAALAVGATLVPISVHRRVFRQHVKEKVVAAGHWLIQVVMGLLAVIIIGISTLIFSVVRRRDLDAGRPSRRDSAGHRSGRRAALTRFLPCGPV
jgi:uncharacterized membrane protein